MVKDLSNNKVTYLKDYQPPSFLIDSVELTVSLYEDHTTVISHLCLRANPALPFESTLFLNGEGLELQQITRNGEPLSSNDYAVSEHGLTLFNLDQQVEIATTVVIHPEKNTLLLSLIHI